jgi:hypothetical protein
VRRGGEGGEDKRTLTHRKTDRQTPQSVEAKPGLTTSLAPRTILVSSSSSSSSSSRGGDDGGVRAVFVSELIQNATAER